MLRPKLTPEQVEAFDRQQGNANVIWEKGIFPRHPLTCGNGDCRHRTGGVLRVREDGVLYCPHCGYEQAWAPGGAIPMIRSEI